MHLPRLPRLLQRPACALLAMSAFILGGCESTGLGPLDSGGRPPVVAAPLVSPAVTNIDSLPSTGGNVLISLDLSTAADDPDGPENLRTVRAEVYRPTAESPFATVTLADDGMTPDAAAGDGIYSARLQFTTRREQAGRYRVRFSSTDQGGLRSTAREVSALLTRNNTPPVLVDSTLQAPDTLIRPTTGSVLFFVSIAATDEDGLADVAEVFLQNLTTFNRTFLLDDGGAPQTGGISSGDLLAGDGVFSVTLQLPSTTPPGSYPFRLQAVDTFADTSTALPYTLVVQ